MSKRAEVASNVCLVVALLVLVGVVTYGVTNELWCREAIRRGHAEYYFNASLERQWRWLPAPEKGGLR